MISAIRTYLCAFQADESGAATIDWVVGTALSISLTLAVMSNVSDAAKALSTRVADRIANFEMCWDDSCLPPQAP